MSINPLQQQQQTTMNSAALSPYFCPYNWIFGPTSPLYHRYYPHPWCRRKIFVWYVEMLPKYTAECPTIKNNTNNNAVTIASLFLYHRTLGNYPSLSSYWEAPSIAANDRIMSNVHHRLPPTTVSCRTNVELYATILCVNGNGRPSLIHQ